MPYFQLLRSAGTWPFPAANVRLRRFQKEILSVPTFQKQGRFQKEILSIPTFQKQGVVRLKRFPKEIFFLF